MAESADAQPSGGCDRKVVEVQLLSSAPRHTATTMKWFAILILSGTLNASAQVLKPIDPNKQADEINNKTVQAADVNLNTISQPTRSFPTSPLTDKQQKLKDVNTKTVDLNTLQRPTIPQDTLPQKNFTAKRATESNKTSPDTQKTVKQPVAPIPDRQLHPFAPGGEDELKKQFHPERQSADGTR